MVDAYSYSLGYLLGVDREMIIGIDENNFSPSLSGDCIVVSLTRKKGIRKIGEIKDSKQLTGSQRLMLFEKIQKTCHYSIALATVNDIADEGIYLARNYAIDSVIDKLVLKLWCIYKKHPMEWIKKIVIDGRFSVKWLHFFNNQKRPPVECLVNGDQKIYEISAASIVGRVYADALFAGFGSFYPGYRLEKNHGSPDKIAYKKIRESGPTPYHRTENYAREWWKKIYGGEK